MMPNLNSSTIKMHKTKLFNTNSSADIEQEPLTISNDSDSFDVKLNTTHHKNSSVTIEHAWNDFFKNSSPQHKLSLTREFKSVSGAHNMKIPHKRWLSEMFSEAKRNFDMHSTVGRKCKEDYETYKLHFRNQTTWAVQS